jgi:hypothetical protein
LEAVAKKRESSHAGLGDLVLVHRGAIADELAEIIPAKGAAVFKLLQQSRGIERVARLPELENDKATDEISRGSGFVANMPRS